MATQSPGGSLYTPTQKGAPPIKIRFCIPQTPIKIGAG
jgi:hypothetical protein